jgi:hypothetical protein
MSSSRFHLSIDLTGVGTVTTTARGLLCRVCSVCRDRARNATAVIFRKLDV